MHRILKSVVILVGTVVVTRLIMEEADAPSWLSGVFGVTWLLGLIPGYLATKIARSNEMRPYFVLARVSVGFVLIAASMVGITYSLAYPLGFSAYRFTVDSGGVVGDSVTPVQGLIMTPLTNFGLTLGIGLAAAIVIGPSVLWILRRSRRHCQDNFPHRTMPG